MTPTSEAMSDVREYLAAKHTPGPWHPRGNQVVVFRKDTEAAVLAEVKHFEGAKWQDGDAVEMGANLNLMSAAPELLAALHHVRAIITEASMTGFNSREGNWAELLFASQAMTHRVVSKAKGRS